MSTPDKIFCYVINTFISNHSAIAGLVCVGLMYSSMRHVQLTCLLQMARTKNCRRSQRGRYIRNKQMALGYCIVFAVRWLTGDNHKTCL